MDGLECGEYRGTSLIRNSAPLGPYSRTMSRALWSSWGDGAVSYERGTPVGFAVLQDGTSAHPPHGVFGGGGARLASRGATAILGYTLRLGCRV